jgi:hypothetical protein
VHGVRDIWKALILVMVCGGCRDRRDPELKVIVLLDTEVAGTLEVRPFGDFSYYPIIFGWYYDTPRMIGSFVYWASEGFFYIWLSVCL